MTTPDPDKATTRLWSRVRIDAAIHELHLAEMLVRGLPGGDFAGGQIRHLADQLRLIRDRLR